MSLPNNNNDPIRLVLLDLYGFLRETAQVPVPPQGSLPVWRESPTVSGTRLLGDLSPPTVNHKYRNTYPHHYGPYKQPIPPDCYTYIQAVMFIVSQE